MKIEQGNTYIFVENRMASASSPFKGKVEEITETTYLIDNLDNSNRPIRYQKDKFNKEYKMIETVSTKDEELEKLVKTLSESKSNCPNGPGPCYCTGACKISTVFGPNKCKTCHGMGTIVDYDSSSGIKICPDCYGEIQA